MTFVRPRSNSGCTAALVMLMKEHDLQPERDYTWGFSYGHETSIKGIAEKTGLKPPPWPATFSSG